MISRLFLGTLGCIMLAWGVGMPAVALFGEETRGRITVVRRQLGDRGGAIPNRYTYVINYKFNLPDGTRVDGFTQRLGDYFSPKTLTQGRTVSVRYFPRLPWLNTIDWNWGATFEYIVVAMVGGLLIYLSRKKASSTAKRDKRALRKKTGRP